MHMQVSHMGHARNYLTSDVIRRVLEDYFGYNIHFVMNVTDVDDKIIVKARRAHHLQRFRRSSPQPEEVILVPSLIMDMTLPLDMPGCMHSTCTGALCNASHQQHRLGTLPHAAHCFLLQVRDQVQRALQSALQGQQQTVQRLEQDVQAAEAKAAKQPDSVRRQSMSMPCHIHGFNDVLHDA